MSATLSQVWRSTVQSNPDAIAVINTADGQVWTRSRLSGLVKTWCDRVPNAASIAGKRVAMSVPNGLDWWGAFLGLQELGAVPVLIDASEPTTRQIEIASGARAVALWSRGEWIVTSKARTRVETDACLVKLTSGSTGKPKAWQFTHAQMLADGRQVCSSMGIKPGDLNLAAIPLGHSYGLGNLVVPLIEQGTGMVLVDSPLPNILAAAAARWNTTVFPAVPTLLDALVRSAAEPEKLKSVRLVISAGASLSPVLAVGFAKKFGKSVHNFYGTSETGGICYDRTGAATQTGRSVGTPLDGVVLKWRNGRRFFVESRAVVGRGLFSPLDFGQHNDWGELVLVGRSGRVVKVGARRVDLGEIEAALKSIPGVGDAFAAVSGDGHQAIAVAVATILPKSTVRAALLEKLPTWKLPHKIVTMMALPVTLRGKLDKQAVESLLSSRIVDQSGKTD